MHDNNQTPQHQSPQSSWATLVAIAGLLAVPIIGSTVFAGCSVAVVDQLTSAGETDDAGGSTGNSGWGSDGGTDGTAGPTGTTGDPTGGPGSDSDPTDWGSTSGTTDPGTEGSWTDTGGDSEGEPDESTGEPEPDTGTDTDIEPVCDDMNDVTLFLSPDDSNSMSSPVQVRETILVYKDLFYDVPVRTWEFMNYYNFAYPPAQPGDLGLHVELVEAESSGDQPEYILQIGVSSETVTDDTRAPINLTLALDQSGSMQGQPIAMLRKSCEVMASKLREGDKVSIVTWDTDNTVKLGGYVVEGPNDPMVLDVINAIDAGGGTDLHSGLVKGYELSELSFDPERINRMVLISDGGANVGVTDEELIAEHAGSNDEDGIYMVGVGVGDGPGYNDKLMDTVTDLGKGASVYIPDAAEAEKIFGEQFVNTMAVAARDVQVQLDLPAGFEIVKFSGEEFGTDPSEIEPQHIAPNDAMVFHQRITTCAPELLEDGTAEVVVTVRWKDAKTFEPKSAQHTIAFTDLLSTPSPQLLKGAAIFAYAEAAKAVKSQIDVSLKISEAQQAVADAKALLPDDQELDHIAQMLDLLSQ